MANSIGEIIMKFEDIKIGDIFECFGDIDLGIYSYPKICKMMKLDEFSAAEYEISSESILIAKSADFRVIKSANPDALVEYRKTKDGWVAIPEIESKPRPGMSAFYCGMYPELAEVARKHGYALTVHGSLRKDFDLFAVPWVENPSEPKVFLEELTKQFALKIVGEPDYQFGRERWTLHFTFGEAWLDIQFFRNFTNVHISRARHVRKQAITVYELTKNINPNPSDTTMKTLLEFTGYLLELTGNLTDLPYHKPDPYEGTRS